MKPAMVIRIVSPWEGSIRDGQAFALLVSKEDDKRLESELVRFGQRTANVENADGLRTYLRGRGFNLKRIVVLECGWTRRD